MTVYIIFRYAMHKEGEEDLYANIQQTYKVLCSIIYDSCNDE